MLVIMLPWLTPLLSTNSSKQHNVGTPYIFPVLIILVAPCPCIGIYANPTNTMNFAQSPSTISVTAKL